MTLQTARYEALRERILECRIAARHRRATPEQVVVNGELEIELQQLLHRWIDEGKAESPEPMEAATATR